VAKKTPRAGRTLIAFGIAVALLYAAAALGKDWSPQLGLDLEGGTRITLTASKTPSQTQLKLASSIIDERVNGSGVSESEVSTQGNKNIVVEIPGKQRKDLIDAVKRTAQLRFRLVAAGSPQSGQPQPSPSASPSGTASPSGSPEQEGHGQAEWQVHRRRHCHAEAAAGRPDGRHPEGRGQGHHVALEETVGKAVGVAVRRREPCGPLGRGVDRRPAEVAAQPRHQVDRGVLAVHVPSEGPEPRPGRRRPGPAADHL
jgi:preprotein translocase subunit SecD